MNIKNSSFRPCRHVIVHVNRSISNSHSSSFIQLELWRRDLANSDSIYLLSYGTHAMTVKPLPGDTTYNTIVWTLGALLLPVSGIFRACVAINAGRLPGESDLEHQLRAGTLCELVKWGDALDRRRLELEGIDRVDLFEGRVAGFRAPFWALQSKRKIHGQIVIPDMYRFLTLRHEIRFAPPFHRVEQDPQHPEGNNRYCPTCRLGNEPSLTEQGVCSVRTSEPSRSVAR